MPIVYAAVVPHSPLLIPEVSKQHQRLVEKTRTSLTAAAEELYAAQPDVLMILTPHGTVLEQTFVVHQAEEMKGGLSDFGDVQTNVTARGAVKAAHQLKELAEDQAIPIALQTLPALDYGVTVPGTFFFPPNLKLPILPLTIAEHDPTLIIRLGKTLNDFCQGRSERFAIVASADLTSRSKDADPARANRPTPEEKTIAEAISAVDPSKMLGDTGSKDTCGRGPILALLATLQPLRAHGQIQSFEAPFGVGLMVGSFNLNT